MVKAAQGCNHHFCGHHRKGAALFEFALMAPLVILFTLGLIDLGRMTMAKQMLVNNSREGARQASLPNATTESAHARVQEMMSNAGVSRDFTMSPSVIASSPPGSTITVTVTAQANSVSWLGRSLFLPDKTLTAATSIRKESF
ncbi:MAG: TadE/TadG family type IV pilus assembly protein [Pirellula sp.]